MKTVLIIGVVILFLLSGLGVQSWRLSHSQQLNEQQKTALKTQQDALNEKSNQLDALAGQLKRSDEAQARLRDLAAQTRATLSNRQKLIERLKRENQELKHWADTLLPADVIRLRQRPALIGGSAYRKWLSDVDAVPVPGIQSAD
ncbi:LysB family phage lysis regulatory protein [Pectobacterium aroidearum]|uniref:LysB family phage lysis regulatory protein n=1 Tax=Pectobacterium aroidearum TaxID=1201031 RepID=A0ABR5Z879_9GAMM|nr:Rz-like lysis system protein LysB [Pectobacterium aroidearum]MBA5197930.1 LysB family phage lysis regulatory protein [Pectobacterium aroidearum]MBA5230723.1 LysB family phage lysis regulatory protein [Pectobacterium aroidearum]